MRNKLLFLLPLFSILLITLFLSNKNATYFIPFDEAQIQNHYSSSDLVHFYQRLRKKKWKTLRRLYHSNLAGRKKRHKNERIPKILHQIWLGSPVPEKYREFQQTWIHSHPDWEYHLWTDDEAEVLYLKNQSLYETAQTDGQRSRLLRYEILSEFGGVYIDMAFECLKPLDILIENCDFISGLTGQIHLPEIPEHLIGAKPGHPIIKRCMEKLKTSTLLDSGPSFLTQAFLDAAKKRGRDVNVVLPCSYFYPAPDQTHDYTFALYHD